MFLRRAGFDNRLFGAYLHHIDRPDPGFDLHDHPWPFVSIILRGGYTEEYADTRMAAILCDVAEKTERKLAQRAKTLRLMGHSSKQMPAVPDHLPRGEVRTWARWSIHRIPLGIAHRIAHAEPGTVTLVIRGPKCRSWGFYPPFGFIPHWDYRDLGRRPSVDSSDPRENEPS